MAKVKDLKDQIITDDVAILYCTVCGATESANAGDYFMADPEHVFMCCDEPMQLVIKHTVYEIVEQAYISE